MSVRGRFRREGTVIGSLPVGGRAGQCANDWRPAVASSANECRVNSEVVLFARDSRFKAGIWFSLNLSIGNPI